MKHYLSWMALLWWSAVEMVDGEGTELLYKTIVTRTDVSNQAALALDLRDMILGCQAMRIADATDIYIMGKNSPRVDRFGHSMQKKRSLSHVVDEEGSPTRSLTHVWAMLAHPPDLTDASAIETSFTTNSGNYDLMVRSLFSSASLSDNEKTSKCLIAVEAATVFKLWMHASFELWDSLYDCAASSMKGYNSDADAMHDNDNGALAMDEFMAYWVGEGATDEDNSGYALYRHAHEAAKQWNTLDPFTNQPTVHVKIQQLYEEAAGLALSQKGACTSANTNTLPHLWSLANRIQSQLYVPLIQGLLSAIETKDKQRTDIYARAIIPQMVQCPNSRFKELKAVFLDYDNIADPNTPLVQDQIGVILSILDCLGLTCADIGYSNTIPMCTSDPPPNPPLAHYAPLSNILQQSKMDLDLYQMHLLMMVEFSSDVFDFVEYYYKFGKNSILDKETMELRSLQSLAKATQRKSAVPYYLLFEQYFDDSNYADTIIMQIFQAEGKWSNAPRSAKRTIIETTLQAQVMFMYVLSELADLQSDCKNRTPYDNPSNANALDEVAAYMIGSLEGPADGNSEDGMLHWNLANKRAITFNRFNLAGGIAQVNDDLINLLFSARGELRAFDCQALELTVKHITAALLIPLYQSVIYYADRNEAVGAFTGSPNMGGHVQDDIAAGEAYTLALLPMLAVANPNSAKIVHDNMITVRGIKPVKDKAQGVADAMAATLNHYGISCVEIGLRDDADICQMYVAPFNPTPPGITRSSASAFSSFYGMTISLIFTTVWILNQ